MNRALRWITASATMSITALGAGSVVVAGTGSTEPPPGSAESAAGCAEVAALLDSRTTLATALINGDPALIEATLAELSSVASAAANAAPAEIDAEIDTLAATVDATVTALEGVELS